MWCPKVLRLVSAYLDRELDSATEAGVTAHIDRCILCRRALKKVKLGALLARKAQDAETRPPDMEMLARIRSAGGGIPE